MKIEIIRITLYICESKIFCFNTDLRHKSILLVLPIIAIKRQAGGWSGEEKWGDIDGEKIALVRDGVHFMTETLV